MNIGERLSFFTGLIRCNYNLFLWNYDKDFRLLSTNCPKELISGDMITALGFLTLLHAHVEQGNRNPLVLDTEFGLLWIAAFEYQDVSLRGMHLIGPAFTGKNTQLLIRKKLDSYNISVKLRSIISRQLEEVPIIPSTTLLQYAVMLHYSVTGAYITTDSVYFSSSGSQENTDDISLISGEHRGIYLAEQNLLSAIREGSPDYKKALDKCISLSNGIHTDSSDNLRENKNNALVLLTLCSRASMEGGLHSSVAYALYDLYAMQIEECRTTADATNLTRRLLADYVERVRQTREHAGISIQIQSILDYIAVHIKENLSLSELAERLGYTEYYFSHKFKQETGCSVNAYIRQKKVETAKLLLSGSHMSIQQISDELSFSSRSYFYSCFERETGMSPSAYRETYGKV